MRANVLKLLAIVLAVLCLFTAAACGIGIVYCVEYELQTQSAESGFVREMARRLARDYAQVMLAKRYGGMAGEEEFLLETHRVAEVVENNVVAIDLAHGTSSREDVVSYQFTFRDMIYPVVLEEGEEVPAIPAVREETHRVWINGGYRNYTLLYCRADYPVYV